jgi:hypothetical protein
MISGMVKAEELRSGDNLPVAGARLVSPDGTHIVGFQLVAASAKSKQFDIILNTKRNDLIQQENFGQVAVIESIRFNLSVSNTGKVTLLIGVKSFNAEYVPILESNAMVFCSTAQFKFSEVVFSNTDSTGR